MVKSTIDWVAGTKHCGRCDQNKPLADFYFWKKKQRWGGYCKDCRSELQKIRDAKQAAVRQPRQLINVGECIVDFCDRPQKARHYCNAHWTQMATRGYVTEIKESKKSKIPGLDTHRRCTMCDMIKPVEQFYNRTNGTKQSACVACSVLGTRFDFLMREKRYAEAAALTESMPERLREKKVSRLPDGYK